MDINFPKVFRTTDSYKPTNEKNKVSSVKDSYRAADNKNKKNNSKKEEQEAKEENNTASNSKSSYFQKKKHILDDRV